VSDFFGISSLVGASFLDFHHCIGYLIGSYEFHSLCVAVKGYLQVPLSESTSAGLGILSTKYV
jgi:hypothetical protein